MFASTACDLLLFVASSFKPPASIHFAANSGSSLLVAASGVETFHTNRVKGWLFVQCASTNDHSTVGMAFLQRASLEAACSADAVNSVSMAVFARFQPQPAAHTFNIRQNTRQALPPSAPSTAEFHNKINDLQGSITRQTIRQTIRQEFRPSVLRDALSGLSRSTSST